MTLDEDGEIAICIAAEKPAGVPDDNLMPIERKDLAINAMFRLYAPDIQAYETCKSPEAERLR